MCAFMYIVIQHSKILQCIAVESSLLFTHGLPDVLNLSAFKFLKLYFIKIVSGFLKNKVFFRQNCATGNHTCFIFWNVMFVCNFLIAYVILTIILVLNTKHIKIRRPMVSTVFLSLAISLISRNNLPSLTLFVLNVSHTPHH